LLIISNDFELSVYLKSISISLVT